MNELSEAIKRIHGTRVLVLGDIILDRYTFGDTERISPEAPVPILNESSTETRLGGAAAVAALVEQMEGQATLVGVIGNDAAATEFWREAGRANLSIEGVLVDPTRPTVTKHRFLGGGGHRSQQLLRVDTESQADLGPNQQSDLAAFLEGAISQHDVVLVSDYAKGTCTQYILSLTLQLAAHRNIPVIVDPGRNRDFELYRGAFLIKPNRSETEDFFEAPLSSTGDIAEAARRMANDYAIENVLITLDRDGMFLQEVSGSSETIATEKQEVFDVTGAGDTVLAMLGVSVGAGIPLRLAANLANSAAGVQLKKAGVGGGGEA